MTTLDAIVLLLIVEGLLSVAWYHYCKARQYGRMRTKVPPPPTTDEPSGPQGPMLDPKNNP